MLRDFLRNIYHATESSFVSTKAREEHIRNLAHYVSAELLLTMTKRIEDIFSKYVFANTLYDEIFLALMLFHNEAL
jgi:hypothetical protein